MPTKAELYAQMADKVATQLTGSWQEWAEFLTTASRLYKYPFHEQLMIYAQRPDATACAEYDLWNEKMGRYVRRGSKGIALVDDSGDRPRLRYVFDISDTGTREHSRTPWLWQLEERHLDSVQAMLERIYDVSGDDLAGQLTEVAGKLAEEYWTEHQQDFFYIVDGSFLEEYDEYNIGVQFKAAATVSITYALMSRCGLEPERYFDHEDFMAIFDFNTPSTIGALGTAVSQINQQVLRQIGVTVRNAEREANQERSKQDEQSHDLHPERRLSDSRPEAEPAAGETPGQVRKDEESLPERTPSHPLQPDAAEREAVPAPSGDRRDRPEQTGADDTPAGEGSRSHRGTESQRSHEVGGADEHLQSPGRGDPDGGAYQQLTLNLFLSEAEQIQSIDEAENVAHTSSAFSFAQNDIDHVLRLGGNTDRQRERVVAAFEKQKTTAEIAEILKTLYHGGNGLGSVSAWYAEDGIHLSHEKSVRYDRSAQVISWESAAERIGELLESGQFASNVELAEAAGYERSLLAEKLWHLYHDFSDKARDSGYLSCLSCIQRTGFPEETAWLAEQLSDPAFRQTLKEEYAAFWTTYQQDRDLLRFHYHRPREIWENLKDLDLPRRTFSSDLSQVPTVQHFITEDEIDAAMTGGSSFVGGKGRIYAFFMENHTDKEKVRFLKDEYGIGGRSHSYAIVDGQVYYRENSRMVRPDLNATAETRVKGLVGLRDCVQELIDLQMDAAVPDSTIREKQAELNSLYDSFSSKYGLINDRANRLAYADDSSYYLLCALEVIDEDGKLERKADMFTKRTIKPHQAVATVDTASEALAVSISEKACVNMSYMSRLTGKTKEALAGELQGVIFRVPGQLEQDGTPHYVTADEYLSGNVRRKLRQAQRAAQQDPSFAVNVEALTAAQPKDLDASEIEVRLGATWIDKEYIQQFMYETFNTPFYLQRSIEVNYSSFTAEWQIKGKSSVSYNDVAAYTTYGTSRANAYKILEDSLNLRDVRIYDTIEDADGKERRVLNAKETTLAAQKQQAIREAFRDWIWRDPERRQTLVRQYNEEMNSTRPREYDGSHITFGGMNPAITLREHQKSAIAHVLYGGNTLLAHEVGAGKTFEMVAAAMEAKRLGLCQKSLFVVPNHLTEQWASEFLRLYPSANILVTTKKDFETHNRKKFCARIATGDYDAIIMGHSQFERIPISRERQERLLYEQIDEITEGIAEVQASGGERFTVKQLERTRKSLEARLEKLQAEGRKDDVVTFEQLGVDRLFVDEAHNYKNLFLYTKMRNVAGLSTSDAQKSSDMFAKCRYMDEITGNRGVIFATGTPVSNSMTELYTMQRYLQYERLQELNMTHFDCWASRFGETVTALELAPEGTGYRARTRFSKFFNLPELMNLFKEVADIKTADQLNLPTPEVEYHNVVAQPTEHQQEMVKALSERASLVHSGTVDPSQDNMLKITSDGRKLGLDQRIVNQMLPDEPGTKVNQCVDNIMQIWRDGKADKLTQLVFCDISTPQAKAPASKAAKTLDNPLLHALEGTVPLPEQEPAFTVYDDIRQKLIAQGMPADQIAFIHEANTEVRKKELFSKVRTGQVRVLLGSTAKMGAGTNVQDRLVALHDLDCPWRPGDLAQRKGRIERQGNQNPLVHVYRYVTEGTFDAYLWQTVENKQKFISQIMTSKSPVRSCDDVDETALSFAEIKALCAGDPRIKERMDLDVEVSRLKLMKADHQSKQYRLEDQLLKYFPEEIEKHKGFIKGFESDLEVLAAHPHPEDGFAGMEIRGDLLTDKENAGAALLDACKEVKTSDPVQIGNYRGYAISVEFSAWKQEYTLLLKGQMTHRATLGTDPRGNLTRIDNSMGCCGQEKPPEPTGFYHLPAMALR